MARRSLNASPQGIKIAKQAFERKGWTQNYLARQAGLQTRQPIWKFFSGRPVDRHIFTEICFQLGLEFEEIVELPVNHQASLSHSLDQSNSKIDALVKKIRQQRYEYIQAQCSIVHLLDVARPIAIEDLFVMLNIGEELTSRQWLTLKALQTSSPQGFEQVCITGKEAIAKYAKLMVLGKPGGGKTTFLQYLASQCNEGKLQPQQIPVFIRLKSFAEDAQDRGNFNLLDYLHQEFALCGVSKPEVTSVLTEGRVFLLFDGLDEVPQAQIYQVIKHIRQVADKYYKNPLIITCRLASQEYRFQGFTEVEIADFTPGQIEAFVHNWFVCTTNNQPELGSHQASLCLERLNLPENSQIRELANNPLLLNLICLVFQAQNEFSNRRSDLYQQGVDLLLMHWDETKGIQRDIIYPRFSLPHKLELLSTLAAVTFEQGDCFFGENQIRRLITDYLRNLPQIEQDTLTLAFDSGVVLKAIEAQHGLLVERARGIYSFSHLTWQEYFTARKIVRDVRKYGVVSLQKLLGKLTDQRWREIFVLTAQMLPDATEFLQMMSQQVEVILAKEARLQVFLDWIGQKSLTVATYYHPAAVRAVFLSLALPKSHQLPVTLDHNLANENAYKHLSAKLESQISQDWQFSAQEQQLLEQYCYGNKLLLDCLDSTDAVTRDLRDKITDNLLLSGINEPLTNSDRDQYDQKY